VGGTRSLFLTLSPEDPLWAPERQRTLTATCFLPADVWVRDQEYEARKSRVAQEIMESLKMLIVFLEEGIVFAMRERP